MRATSLGPGPRCPLSAPALQSCYQCALRATDERCGGSGGQRAPGHVLQSLPTPTPSAAAPMQRMRKPTHASAACRARRRTRLPSLALPCAAAGPRTPTRQLRGPTAIDPASAPTPPPRAPPPAPQRARTLYLLPVAPKQLDGLLEALVLLGRPLLARLGDGVGLAGAHGAGAAVERHGRSCCAPSAAAAAQSPRLWVTRRGVRPAQFGRRGGGGSGVGVRGVGVCARAPGLAGMGVAHPGCRKTNRLPCDMPIRARALPPPLRVLQP